MKLLVLGVHLRREEIEPAAMALSAGPLFLSAIEIGDHEPLGDRALLMRAADVRRRLLEQGTFIAIRYGFTAPGEAAAALKCTPHLERWTEVLRRHEGEVEMTLKVVAADRRPRPARQDFTGGAEYLRALHAATRSVTIAPGFRSAAESAFAPLSSDQRWIARDGSSMELAVLVRRASADEVMDAGRFLKTQFPDVPFLLSGPWPLEVFADADLE